MRSGKQRWGSSAAKCPGPRWWNCWLGTGFVNRAARCSSTKIGLGTRRWTCCSVASAAVAEKDRLYRALDRIAAHKAALEQHLAERWCDLFGASFDVLLYDLTSTYFEGEAGEVEKAARGYSWDKRPDRPQLVIAVVVTPEGFPLNYEVFDGNRAEVTTLEAMLEAIQAKYSRARRIWIFDRCLVSEANLEKLRERGGQYVVGTPRHQLDGYEQALLEAD